MFWQEQSNAASHKMDTEAETIGIWLFRRNGGIDMAYCKCELSCSGERRHSCGCAVYPYNWCTSCNYGVEAVFVPCCDEEQSTGGGTDTGGTDTGGTDTGGGDTGGGVVI